MGFEARDVVAAGIPHPMVGVVEQAAGEHFVLRQSHFQGLQSQNCPEAGFHGPTHDAPDVGIENCRHIGESLAQLDIGDVRRR